MSKNKKRFLSELREMDESSKIKVSKGDGNSIKVSFRGEAAQEFAESFISSQDES